MNIKSNTTLVILGILLVCAVLAQNLRYEAKEAEVEILRDYIGEDAKEIPAPGMFDFFKPQPEPEPSIWEKTKDWSSDSWDSTKEWSSETWGSVKGVFGGNSKEEQ